jgi:hypothetical protein
MDIALQHLDEFPDYYTRLKKMEADAKKHHKKFKDVKEALDGKSARDPDYSLKDWFNDEWVQTGGKYDGKPCAKQPGQTTKPYCRDPDDRAAMSKEERNKRSTKKRKEDPNPNRSGKAKMVTQESAGEKDACYKKVKSRYDVWPSAYASGALVKCRKVGAANWGTKSEACWDGYVAKGMKKKGKKMVPNCVPVNSESTDALEYDWHTPIRERADRYCPKCEKLETRNECKYGPRYWDTFSLPAELIGSKKEYNTIMPHPANEDYEYSMARSEISTIIGAAKRLRKKIGKGEGNIEAWVQSKITKAADYLDTAADYVDSGEMKKESVSIEDINGNHYAEFIDIIKPEPLKASRGIGSRMLGEGKLFDNFMIEASAAWQRKEGKNPEGGLNKKGIASYRKENPGSKLSMAVTTPPSKLKPGSKSANRRKSFCARMGGMPGPMKDEKGSPTRKALSLRKWNC